MTTKKIRVGARGKIALPSEILQALDVDEGSYLSFEIDDAAVTLKKLHYDPFLEAGKKPDPDGFEKIMKQQKEGMKAAEQEFRERLKKPPELRPEDRPDFWD